MLWTTIFYDEIWGIRCWHSSLSVMWIVIFYAKYLNIVQTHYKGVLLNTIYNCGYSKLKVTLMDFLCWSRELVSSAVSIMSIIMCFSCRSVIIIWRNTRHPTVFGYSRKYVNVNHVLVVVSCIFHPKLLSGAYFTNMDRKLHPFYSVWWNYLSSPKLQRCSSSNLVMD